MSERKPYQSDLTDEQWALIEPVLTAWKNRHRSVSGHQGRYSMREIVNSILSRSETHRCWSSRVSVLVDDAAQYSGAEESVRGQVGRGRRVLLGEGR
ncbi:transposase, partial [Streptomyces mirabilis]|uniref:transposase n=1 Tax=Streptomyces mirabilis TaxID=68239 RepID=UPI0033C93478